MGGPCQHLHPNKQAGSRKSLSREEVSEMDRGKGDGSRGCRAGRLTPYLKVL